MVGLGRVQFVGVVMAAGDADRGGLGGAAGGDIQWRVPDDVDLLRGQLPAVQPGGLGDAQSGQFDPVRGV